MQFTSLLLALFAHASSPVDPPCAPQSSSRPQRTAADATAEGVEILRRILADSLDRTTDDRARLPARQALRMRLLEERDDQLVTQFWSDDRTVQHSRGFHVPGEGVLLAFDVAVRVVQASPAPADEDDAADQDDEWERTKREVRTKGSVLGSLGPESGGLMVGSETRDIELDPVALREIEDAVLRTLARHASRIEGLAAGDAITVALHLSGSHATLPLLDLSPDTDGDGAVERSERGYSFHTWFASPGVAAPEQRLVIRVALQDLAGSDDANLERLRQRALIHRY